MRHYRAKQSEMSVSVGSRLTMKYLLRRIRMRTIKTVPAKCAEDFPFYIISLWIKYYFLAKKIALSVVCSFYNSPVYAIWNITGFNQCYDFLKSDHNPLHICLICVGK